MKIILSSFVFSVQYMNEHKMCVFCLWCGSNFVLHCAQRLDSYYKRNYKDYFELMEGTLKSRDGKISDTEKGILDWLQKNK